MLTLTQMKEISTTQNVIFYKPNCPFCFASRVLLDKLVANKIINEYHVYMLGEDFDDTTLTQLIEQSTTWKKSDHEQAPSKPQIFLDGNYVGGNVDFYQSSWNVGEGKPNLPLPKHILEMKYAREALNAWETGQKTGNFSDFKQRLSNEFNVFSHPTVGKVVGENAKQTILDFIEEQEKNTSRIEFSNITFTKLENSFAYQFDVKSVNGNDNFNGFNMIKIVIEDEKIVTFQEYYGIENNK